MRNEILTTLPLQAFENTMLKPETWGEESDPLVLILMDATQDHGRWRDIAEALSVSGRYAALLRLSMAEAGAATEAVAELRALLGRLSARPLVIGVGGGADIACDALREDGALLAVGLAMVDGKDGAKGERGESFAIPTMALAFADIATAPVPPTGEASSLNGAQAGAALDDDEALLGQLLSFLESHQPRAAREFRAGSDPRTLRDAMGCFATGVTVVTSLTQDGDPIGLTANSFTSVSLDPPLLLVCIANSSGSAEHLRQMDRFGVNVLHIGQQPASSRFASKSEDRFSDMDWSWGETGVPVLSSSLVSFECARDALHEAGDHFILVGHVQRAQFEPHRDPLLFFRGKYRRLHFT